MYFENLIALCEVRLLMLMAKHKYRGVGTIAGCIEMYRLLRQQAIKFPAKKANTSICSRDKCQIYIYV